MKLPRLVRGLWLLRAILKTLAGIQAELHVLATIAKAEWEEKAASRRAAGQQQAPSTEVSYVNDWEQFELMQIETELLQAKGLPPSVEEVVAEYERRHPEAAEGSV